MTRKFMPLLMLTLLVAAGCSDDAADSTAVAPEDELGAGESSMPADLESAGASEVDDSAEGAMRALMTEVAAGKTGALWAAMPEDYQQDVTELVQGFASGVDPNLWQQVMGLVGNLHSLLDRKGEFIVNSATVQQSGQAEQVKTALPSVTAVLKTLLDSLDLEALKAFDGEQFFSGPVAQLMTHGNTLSQMAPGGVSLASLQGAEIETISEEGDNATLKMTSPVDPTQSQEVKFVRVDGHWLPADMVNDWDNQMESAKEQLATLPETSKQAGMQFGMVTGMVTGMLAPLEAAETQEDFDKALQEVQGSVMGMMSMMGGGFSLGGDQAAPEAAEEPALEESPGLEEAAPAE